MNVLTTSEIFARDRGAIDVCARCLEGGGLVAFPTETVYGLGAGAGNGRPIPPLYVAQGPPAL